MPLCLLTDILRAKQDTAVYVDKVIVNGRTMPNTFETPKCDIAA